MTPDITHLGFPAAMRSPRIQSVLLQRLLLLLITARMVVTATPSHMTQVPNTMTMAFGSCALNISDDSTYPPASVFTHIANSHPSLDLFAWTGDAVYHKVSTLIPALTSHVSSPAELSHLYNGVLANPQYRELVEKTTTVIGTWDDHDYGQNDGDRTNPHREGSKHAYLDFLGVPNDHPRRSRHGVYSSIRFDLDGEGDGREYARIVMLDVRFNAYHPDQTLLGEEQWAWLESVLEEDPNCVLTVVASGTQILKNSNYLAEGWHHYPEERNRLLDLLMMTKSPTVLLSGDVHYGEVSNITHCSADLGLSQKFVEVTASGLTHAWGDKNALLQWFLLSFVIYPSPTTWGVPYLHRNFGSLHLDTSDDEVVLSLHDARSGSVALSLTHPLSTLAPVVLADDLCAPRTPSFSPLRLVSALTIRRILGFFAWLLRHSLLPVLGWYLFRRCRPRPRPRPDR